MVWTTFQSLLAASVVRPMYQRIQDSVNNFHNICSSTFISHKLSKFTKYKPDKGVIAGK